MHHSPLPLHILEYSHTRRMLRARIRDAWCCNKAHPCPLLRVHHSPLALHIPDYPHTRRMLRARSRGARCRNKAIRANQCVCSFPHRHYNPEYPHTRRVIRVRSRCTACALTIRSASHVAHRHGRSKLDGNEQRRRHATGTQPQAPQPPQRRRPLREGAWRRRLACGQAP